MQFTELHSYCHNHLISKLKYHAGTGQKATSTFLKSFSYFIITN